MNAHHGLGEDIESVKASESREGQDGVLSFSGLGVNPVRCHPQVALVVSRPAIRGCGHPTHVLQESVIKVHLEYKRT